MKSESFYYSKLASKQENKDVDLVFCAFDRTHLKRDLHANLKLKFPNAEIVVFSTSGHFVGAEIQDENPTISALTFDTSRVTTRSLLVKDFENSYDLGLALAKECGSDVKGMCIISDGGEANGSELLSGLNDTIAGSVPIFGGMAGDGTRFEKTLVGLNAEPEPGVVVAIGFYGDNIEIGGACNGGWIPLGLDFKVTKSFDNILYELNNRNAYDILYDLLKPENNDDFTKNTLYYPFLLDDGKGIEAIRTPVAVDHENKNITYAGNIPEGSKVKLMKAGTMQLLDATLEAAKLASSSALKNSNPSFVFAVSCVGRRVVLDDFANEEYIEINSVFGDDAAYFGFYSYGEFFRNGKNNICTLYNQTFTLATIGES